MAAPNWQFVLSDLSGHKLGEVLAASERQVVRSLNTPSTATFKILATNPRLSDVLNRDLNLLVYRNTVPQFHGPVVSAQFAADDATTSPSVVVTAADPAWYFDRRVSGKSPTGTLFPSVDRLYIATQLITQSNTESLDGLVSSTGVEVDAAARCGSLAVYIAGPYKKLSECIMELGQTLGGFDWYIRPMEYVSGKIGQFTAAATIGSSRPNAVFEYEGRSNMRAPNYIRGIDTAVNKVYSIPDGGPADASLVREKHDNTSVGLRKRLEEVVDTSGITNSTARDDVLSDHILYRKDPKQVLSFSPDFDNYNGRVPKWEDEYFLGDTVQARVYYNGTTLLDGMVRLYKMQFDIDENNKETLTPTVVNEA